MNPTKWPRLPLLLLALGTVLTIIIVCQVLKPATDPRLDALRAKGYPVTPTQWDAWYAATPDNENAALIYTNAFAQPAFTNDNFFLDNKWLPPRGQPITEEVGNQLNAILTTNKHTLELLYAAAALKSARYPIDLKQGHRVLLPHLASIKRATALLGNRAFSLAAKHENEEAVKAFVAASRVGDSLSREPVLISQLVRYASWSLICARLERAVNVTSFAPGQIARLEKLLSEGEGPDCLERGLAGDLVSGISFFTKGTHDIFSTLGPVGGPPKDHQIEATFAIGLLKATGIFAKDKAFYIDVMSTNLSSARLPYPARFQSNQNNPQPIPPNRFYIMSRMLLPALSRVAVRDADHTARIRVARAVLAIEHYRRENAESLPPDLSALVPRYLSTIPTDPFDGKSLRFKKLSKGYVIYSIGSDGTDDGGKEPVTNKNIPQDLTFIVER
jgi:hypothetical protein